MKSLVTKLFQSNIYVVAVVGSILLSLWITGRDILINSDAVCYLQSAVTIGTSGIHDAMHLCSQARWPFYSTLIYGLSSFFPISGETAAYLINALCSLISVVAFVAIVKQLGATKRVLWLATAVILLSHEFNSVKQYIVRDHGFWAFYLVSIYFLIRYFADCKRRYMLLWNGSLLLATLFRIEGAFFLLLMPWASWFCQEQGFLRRLRSFVELNSLTMLIVAGLLTWLAFHPEQSLADWGRVHEIASQFMHGGYLIWQRFNETSANLAHYVLTPDSARHAPLVLLLVFVVWYLQSIIVNLSVIYSILVGYAWVKKIPSIKNSTKVVLFGYVLINVVVTTSFFMQYLFLSKRYLIALSLVLMLWVPFALDHLIQRRRSLVVNAKPMKWALPVVVFLMVFSSMGGIFDFGHSKMYVADAGEWLSTNIPRTATLYSNDSLVMFYSQHFGNEIFYKLREYTDNPAMKNDSWKKYDFLAMRVGKQEVDQFSSLSMSPIQVFKNKRGDQVRIYQVTH